MSIRIRLLVPFVLAIVSGAISAPLDEPAPQQASDIVAQAVRPSNALLIRNQYNPMLQVNVDCVPGQTTQVTTIDFSLEGTIAWDAIEVIQLFGTGSEETFSSSVLIAEIAAPAGEISLPVNRPLLDGRNVFWLSCRLKNSANLLQHVSATCTSIATSIGNITPRQETTKVKQRIGIALRKHNDDGVHTYRIPALTTSAKGTLLAVYDMRRRMARDLQEDIDIGLSRSLDGGQSWETPRVVMDMGTYGGLPQEQNGCSDPGIIVDQQTGEIFCFAVWMNGKPGKHQWVDDGSEPGFEIGKSAQLMMVSSKDDGLTWTPPENLTRNLKDDSWWLLAPAPQAGLCLSDGTLVMPIQGRTGREPLATFATIMVSRDHGKKWIVGNSAYSGGNECQAAQLSDGSIMLNIRNDRERYRAVAITKDFGQTWQAHATSRTTLIEPNCNGSLLSFNYLSGGSAKHLLLFANPHSQTARTHHTIQVSFDDGNSWPASHRRLLDEGLGAGYPSLTRIDHDHVGIVYEGSQANLVFEKLPIVELMAPNVSL